VSTAFVSEIGRWHLTGPESQSGVNQGGCSLTSVRLGCLLIAGKPLVFMTDLDLAPLEGVKECYFMLSMFFHIHVNFPSDVYHTGRFHY